jgi:hypothetical protein
MATNDPALVDYQIVERNLISITHDIWCGTQEDSAFFTAIKIDSWGSRYQHAPIQGDELTFMENFNMENAVDARREELA